MPRTSPPDTYGLHLTLRLGGLKRDALDNPDTVALFLRTLVSNIGMRILAGPLVAHEEGPEETAGYSGVVILYESHAAIHTYPHRAAAFLDVFSCQQFSIAQVQDTLSAHFGSHEVLEQRVAERGLHWSADVHEEMLAWRGGRGSTR
jgi:S-adenosylmethionine decarboxylase